MQIRKAVPSDIDGIMKIETVSFAKEIQESKNIFLERIKSCTNCFLVFENQNEIFGYISAERWNEIPKDKNSYALGHSVKSHCQKGDFLYISSFAILPNQRGTGLGNEFFKKAINYLLLENTDIKKIVLLVNENWKSAIRIYKKNGFEKILVFDNFFEMANENAFVMTSSVLQ